MQPHKMSLVAVWAYPKKIQYSEKKIKNIAKYDKII